MPGKFVCLELTGLPASVDAAAVFASAAPLQRFLWRRPERSLTMVGVGAAFEAQPSSGEEFASLCRDFARDVQLREPEPLHASATISIPTGSSTPTGSSLAEPSRPAALSPTEPPIFAKPSLAEPFLYGGFSFHAFAEEGSSLACASNSGRPHRPDGEWEEFPSSLLVLPEFFGIDRGDGTHWYVTLPADEQGMPVGYSAARHKVRALLETASAPSSESIEIPAQAVKSAELKESYTQSVRACLEELASGKLNKAVLARRAELQLADTPSPLVVRELLGRLSGRFPRAVTFAFGRGSSTFLGATPELLLRITQGELEAEALAGSRPRGATKRLDQLLAAELRSDPKELAEHAAVVDHLCNVLRAEGMQITPLPGSPSVCTLPGIHHLSTPLQGSLDADPGELWRLAALLHPTPAVGGLPSEDAMEFLHARENFERGWFSSPLGWCDLSGNGEVALTLRCGLMSERSTAVGIFAGAGVVRGSTPEGEWAETETKLRAMLSAFDLKSSIAPKLLPKTDTSGLPPSLPQTESDPPSDSTLLASSVPTSRNLPQTESDPPQLLGRLQPNN